MTIYNVTYGPRSKVFTTDATTEAEARHNCVAATLCDYSGPAGIQSVEAAPSDGPEAIDGPGFDVPSTKAMRAFIKAEGPRGTGRVTGLSIEGLPPFQTIFIYTESAAWCDDSGAGTFAGPSETAAIARFKARVMPGNGCVAYPMPSDGPGLCDCATCKAGGSARFTMTTADQFATVYGGRADDSPAVATVTAPRVMGDDTESAHIGLYTMATTDGATVYAWRYMPSESQVQAALGDVELAADLETMTTPRAAEIATYCEQEARDLLQRARDTGFQMSRASLVKAAARRTLRAKACRAFVAAMAAAQERADSVASAVDSPAATYEAERQSINAARNPAAPARQSRARAKAAARAAALGMAAHDLPATGQSGAFPLWAMADSGAAIDESLDLFSDYGGPFESVRYGVGLPEARETIATRQPGGPWIATGNA